MSVTTDREKFMHIRLLLMGLTLIVGTAMAGDRPPPASWAAERASHSDLLALDHVGYAPLDTDQLASEDAEREAMGKPPRFAYPHETRITPAQRGTWDELAGTSIWRFRVSAEEAVLLNFGFQNVDLPEGTRLYIYTPEAALKSYMSRHQVIGPFDASINKDHGEFWTPNLLSDEAIIEINVPTQARDRLSLELAQVSQGYRGFGTAAASYHQPSDTRLEGDGKQACDTTGGARSGACNQDVACLSEDDPWNDPVRSVGAYQRSGAFACTGSLVNNTANDQRMLFMTATHCITEGQTPSIVVYWNYEWPTCRRPGESDGTDTNPPDPNLSQSGGTFLAATSNPFQGQCTAPDECSDMTLIELDDEANPDFELYWSGWDRRPPPTACGESENGLTDGFCASIHHPGVDEKRITWVDTDMQVGNIAGASGIHWHPFWHPDPPELPNMPEGGPIPPAVTEPGSSGSPLYSADRRFIGILSGGEAFCGATGSALSDLYGGLWNAWDGMGTATTRMRDHLDPVGDEPLFIDGIDGDGFQLHPEADEFVQCGFDDLTIAVEVEALGEFEDPVDLGLDNLPAGVTGDFSVNPVVPTDTTELSLAGLSEAGPGDFAFQIDGSGGDFEQSESIGISLASDIPEVPTLLAPEDGVQDIGLTPTLSWDAASEAAEYQVEIATDSDFSEVVYSTTVEGTSHQVESELETGTDYFWRIAADNICGASDWSDVFAFTTRLEPVLGLTIDELDITVGLGDTASASFDISNEGTGNLVWAIETDALENGGSRSHDPELDEQLELPEFTIVSPALGGEPVEITVPAGVASRGEVTGFSFVGTATGQSGNATWASDTCMIVEAPDGTSFSVGGISGSFAGCDVNDWDFQGSQSGDDGTYDSEHDDVFDPAVEDEGEWTFTFIHDWDNSSAADMTWSDITVTLHKQPLPVCADEITSVDWLTVAPDSGSVAEGDADSIQVMVDAAELAEGEHIAYLCLTTNDVDNELTIIPVNVEALDLIILRDRFEASD